MRGFWIDRNPRGRKRMDVRIFGRGALGVQSWGIRISRIRRLDAVLLRRFFVCQSEHRRRAGWRKRRNWNGSWKLSAQRERSGERDRNVPERELPLGMGRNFRRNVHDPEYELPRVEQSENRRTKLPDRIFVLRFRAGDMQRVRRERFVYLRLHSRLVGSPRLRNGKFRQWFRRCR